MDGVLHVISMAPLSSHTYQDLLAKVAEFAAATEPFASREIFALLPRALWPLLEKELPPGLALGFASNQLVAKAATIYLSRIGDQAASTTKLSRAGLAIMEVPGNPFSRQDSEGYQGSLAWENSAGITPASLILDIPEGKEEAFMAFLPVGYLWPLPEKIIQQMRSLGLFHVGDVAAMPEADLRSRFGPLTDTILAYCHGDYQGTVQPLYPPPPLEFYLPLEGLDNGLALGELVKKAAAHLMSELKHRAVSYRSLTLEMETTEGTNRNYSRHFHLPQDPQPKKLASQLEALSAKMPIEAPISGFKVLIGELEPLEVVQLSLFDAPWRYDLSEIPTSKPEEGFREQMLTFHDPYRGRLRSPLALRENPKGPKPGQAAPTTKGPRRSGRRR